MLTKAFIEFLLSGTLLSVIWLSILFYVLTSGCFLYNFSEFSLLEQSINTLRLKASK